MTVNHSRFDQANQSPLIKENKKEDPALSRKPDDGDGPQNERTNKQIPERQRELERSR